jgi:parallel beta-helix repeat protein
MNTGDWMRVAAAVLWTAAAQAGSLTPPGAPGATMRTLDEVHAQAKAAEPRTPITGAVTITQPGSYYLATNISGLITIQAHNVTLDLMGFRIAVSSGDAIDIPVGYGSNTVVRNGMLRPGSGALGLDGRYASDCRFEDLRVEGNGAWCGIAADDRCVVRNCDVRGCNHNGITVGLHSEVRDCRVIGGTLDGISAESGCRIIDNVITDHGDDGLRITGSGCYVAGNIVRNNADNYDFAAGNHLNLLLCEIPETLNWPCSVKLAGTLTCSEAGVDGITVASDRVSIDLAGHSLIGPGTSSGHGIYQSSTYQTLQLFNGKAIGWRGASKAGVYAYGEGAQIEHVQAVSNNMGFAVNNNGILHGCTARANADDGFRISTGCILDGCATVLNGGHGILSMTGGVIQNCTATANTKDGVRVGGSCVVRHCSSGYNSGAVDSAGICVIGDRSRIEKNHLFANNRGIKATGSRNFIGGNTAEQNSTNWDIAAGNVCLVVNAITGGAISGNSGGVSPGSTDPNANFTN